MILNNTIACRVCFSTNVKLYHLEAFQLKSYYEEIINEVLTKDDELLNYFCYQCSAVLQKYHSFRQLCIRSQESLKKITTQNLDIPFEATLKWEQYKNKVHPLIKKLDSTAKLGYFEYKEDDNTIIKSFNDPLVNNTTQYAGSSNPYFDSEENYDSNFFASEHINSEYINDAIEIDFKECKTESKNVRQSMSSISDEKNKTKKPSGKIADGNSNGCRKKKKMKMKNPVIKLDPTKWKTVILSNEEALKEIEAKIQKQKCTMRLKHVCEHCQKAFKHIKMYTKHMSCHSEANGMYVCFFCKRRYRGKSILNGHIKHHLEKYHCLQCPQVFSAKQHIPLHEKYHEGVQYACPHCDAKFQKKSTYYSHLRIVHRSSHVCQFCGASFLNESGLRIHRKRAHKSNDTGDKGAYCKRCDMTFENSEAFKEHELNSAKHVAEEEDVFGLSKKLLKGNRQYIECDQCPEQFSSSFLYNRHMERAHNMRRSVHYTDRRTICEICGSSIVVYQLSRHMDKHNGKRFPCPDCDRVYTSPNNMERHRRLHKDPKPFACDLCGKKFTDSTGVRLHVRTVHLKQPHPPRNRTRMKFASLDKSVLELKKNCDDG